MIKNDPTHRVVTSYNTVRWLMVLSIIAAGIYFFHSFIAPVLAALIIAFSSWPIYQWLLRKCHYKNALAATIALLIVLVVLIVPITFGVMYALKEARIWLGWLIEANRYGVTAPDWISALPFVGQNIAEVWNEYLNYPQAVSEMIQIFSGQHLANISRIVMTMSTEIFSLALTLLFMLLTLFFVFKDGHKMVSQIDRVGDRIIPLHWNRFSRVVPTTISATVVGMGLIAIGEGIILGIAYWIAGVPSAVTLGVITGFMALIPGGAPLAFSLVSLYLVGSGSPMAGLGLFLWGSIELFIVDKTIRPSLIGGPIKLPLLLTLFGLIGGVKTMGIIGLFIGPVLMALLLALWREWLHDDHQMRITHQPEQEVER